MTYDEFICECVMRLGTVIPPEKRNFVQSGKCLSHAVDLADTLVKQGFMAPTFGMLQRKLDVYRSRLEEVFEAHSYGVGNLEQTKGLIEAKNDFYEIVDLFLPALLEMFPEGEAKKNNALSHAILRFLVHDVECERKERGLRDILERRCKDNSDAVAPYKALHESMQGERRIRGEIRSAQSGNKNV
jgi:hypothetical protein